MNSKMERKNDNQMWKYAGMVMQFFVSIGIAVFVGLQADKWMSASIPVFSWILPLLVIIGIIIQVMRDTTRKK